MAEQRESCVKPSRGPLGISKADTGELAQTVKREDVAMTAKVGKPAPDFEASAYIDGNFKNIVLSDFKGQWVVLCFYPGDFTFV